MAGKGVNSVGGKVSKNPTPEGLLEEGSRRRERKGVPWYTRQRNHRGGIEGEKPGGARVRGENSSEF